MLTNCNYGILVGAHVAIKKSPPISRGVLLFRGRSTEMYEKFFVVISFGVAQMPVV